MRVSHKFRLHDPVAGLATKLHGLCVMIALIAANRRYQQKHNCAEQKEAKEPTVAHAGKIDPDGRKRARILHDLAMPKKSAQTDKHQSNYEKSRRDQVGQNTDIWISVMGKCIQKEQQRE